MANVVKVAAVQIDPKIGSNVGNLSKILRLTTITAAKGAHLIVFPECALSGYMFTSRTAAMPYMEVIPGPSTETAAKLCKEIGTYVVFGLLEKSGDKCYNSAVLIGPEGIIDTYRKVHLPFLGIDRFLDHGSQPYRIWPTAVGNLGLLICYDINFPEAARTMVLQGADILVLPTNWPQGRSKVPDHVIVTRAFENKVHLVAADRVGSECGVNFLGTSKIIDCWGNTLAEAGRTSEEIIFGEVNLTEARQKKVIVTPGEFEYDFIKDRKPEVYGKLGGNNLCPL